MELTEKELLQIREAVEAQVEELEKSLQEIEQSTKPVTLDQSAVGRVSRIDAIQQQQLQLAAQARMKNRMQALKATIKRLQENEDFGFCQKCEERIPMKRLLARPESPICMNCLNKSASKT